MAGDHPYWDRYKRFFEQRKKAKGYDFHEAPIESVAPPKVTFAERLRWWTWNRRRRIRRIHEERDRRQQEILRIKAAQQTNTRPEDGAAPGPGDQGNGR